MGAPSKQASATVAVHDRSGVWEVMTSCAVHIR